MSRRHLYLIIFSLIVGLVWQSWEHRQNNVPPASTTLGSLTVPEKIKLPETPVDIDEDGIPDHEDPVLYKPGDLKLGVWVGGLFNDQAARSHDNGRLRYGTPRLAGVQSDGTIVNLFREITPTGSLDYQLKMEHGTGERKYIWFELHPYRSTDLYTIKQPQVTLIFDPPRYRGQGDFAKGGRHAPIFPEDDDNFYPPEDYVAIGITNWSHPKMVVVSDLRIDLH